MKIIHHLFAIVLLALCLTAHAAEFDTTPRIAVITAFQPELTLLLNKAQDKKTYSANGVQFTTASLEGKPVVLFLSGISMTNAAMNTQLALERFKITHIVFSGIAGGVNPALHIGDVTVPQQWAQYLEGVFAREETAGKFKTPAWMQDVMRGNFGMIHTRPVEVMRTGAEKPESKFWFPVDAKMMDVAKTLTKLDLAKCNAANKCLSHTPKVVVGGNGVSGQVFMDNAQFREYTFKTFGANVLDMETAATAMVAYANSVPYIAFRSLSDLAGGGEGENEIGTFFQIAADNSANVVLAFLKAWK
ncbi:MAG: 5'-methylthioadenosine/S-adenosylhomocysteine nucleosidase [Burkholderiaceae bacterium]